MCFLLYLGLKTGEGQHLRDVAHVGLVHVDGTTQVALVLRRLLGEDVALERLTALDGATGTDAKTLLRAALGLHLGHFTAPCFDTPAGDSRSGVLDGLQRLFFCAAATRPPHGNLRLSLYCFLFGASTMIIWRPSNFGMCSTTETSASSSRIRSSRRMPMSWCVISRPRNLNVTLPLSPSSAMKRRRLRILML